MFKIIVDARERGVSTHFQKLSDAHHIDFEVRTITTGDYAIVKDDKIIFIFERKTWADLASSMRDGRKENVNKLLKLRSETDCKIAYIIEGDPFPTRTNANRLCNKIPYKNLISHLDHLIYRDAIHVIYTENEADTAARLFTLVKNIVSCKAKEAKPAKSKSASESQEFEESKSVSIGQEVSETQEESKIENDEFEKREIESQEVSKSTRESRGALKSAGAMEQLTAKQVSHVPIAEQILKCLPGVGSIISVALAENKVSIQSLFRGAHSAEDLAMIKYPSGASLGLKKATQIIALPNKLKSISMTAKKMQIRILYAIPLITKKTAECILRKYSFADIMNGSATVELLKDIRKTEKITLGKKAAENIIQYLNPQ